MAIQLAQGKIRTLKEVEVGGKTVFLRADLNVPIQDGRVTDDTRIRGMLPTLKYLVDKKARVVMASHLGRPKGKPDPKYSLVPVAEALARLISGEVIVPDNFIGDGVRGILATQKSEDVVLLENLRFHAEEEKNDPKFAAELRHQRQVYVTDAFGSLHRAHASTDALPRLFDQRAAGFLVEKELQFLAPLVSSPQRPFAVVLGGAKVSDKIKVVENLLRYVDRILLGGAMVFTFLKATGHGIGKSLVENGQLDRAKRILEQAKTRNVQVLLPKDFVVGNSIENPGEPKTIQGQEIPDDATGLDVGPETVRLYGQALQDAKTIFWNGPLGLFEKPPFDAGTNGLARILGEFSSIRVVGGGDSAAAVARVGMADRMTHVSTGGGATLEYLEGNGLPGLTALAV